MLKSEQPHLVFKKKMTDELPTILVIVDINLRARIKKLREALPHKHHRKSTSELIHLCIDREISRYSRLRSFSHQPKTKLPSPKDTSFQPSLFSYIQKLARGQNAKQN